MDKNNTLTLALIAAVAVLLGVGIVKKQTQDPILKELVLSQQRIESQLVKGMPQGGETDLEERVAALEGQLKALTTLLKDGLRPAAPAPQQARPPAEDPNKVYEIPVDHSYVYGNKEAKVTVVEFMDFECPFCARFHSPVFEAVKAFPGEVNFMIKNFPLSFHPNARPAAKAALAAGEQGKYYEMAELLLANIRSLNIDKFKELAKELGLNVDQFVQDYESKDKQWEEIIQKDMTLGGQVDVRGTPTFFVGGKKLQSRDTEGVKKEIQAALDAVK